MCMPGIACQFGGTGGEHHFVSRNEVGRMPDFGGAEPADLLPGVWYQFVFERRGDHERLFIDGVEVLTQTDLLPLPGKGFEHVAFRAWNPVRIRSLTVRRLALPRKASPLVVGDAAVVRADFHDAVEQYLRLAEDFGDDEIAERALTKAYLVASMPERGLDSAAAVIRSRLNSRFPESRYWPLMREIDCLAAWKAGRYGEALTLLGGVAAQEPDTRLALRLVAESEATVLPRETIGELLSWVARTPRVKRLQLDRRGIESLEVLRGLRLERLDIRDNLVQSLEPLQGMPLRHLGASRNMIASLEPLRGAPLATVDISGNAVSDLSPLGGAALTRLSVTRNPVSDLEPLRGMPMVQLSISYCPVRSLEPLRGMPMEDLAIEGCPVESIEALAGMPLTRLDIERTSVADLWPVADAPVVDLEAVDSRIADLSPLSACTTLRSINVENSLVADLEPIRSLNLSVLKIGNTRVASLEPVRNMRLREVTLDGLDITSLEALGGHPLTVLDIRRTPVTDLSVLDTRQLGDLVMDSTPISDLSCLEHPTPTRIEMRHTGIRNLSTIPVPPRRFGIDLREFTREHLEATVRRWRAEGHERQAYALEVRTAVEYGEYERARRLAVSHNGHRYLVVSRYGTRTESDSICALLGAHPATVTSREEFLYLRDLQLAHAMQFWLGLELTPRPDRWVNGEPLTFRIFNEIPVPDSAVSWYQMVSNAAGWFHDGTYGARAGIIAEWDD